MPFHDPVVGGILIAFGVLYLIKPDIFQWRQEWGLDRASAGRRSAG